MHVTFAGFIWLCMHLFTKCQVWMPMSLFSRSSWILPSSKSSTSLTKQGTSINLAIYQPKPKYLAHISWIILKIVEHFFVQRFSSEACIFKLLEVARCLQKLHDLWMATYESYDSDISQVHVAVGRPSFIYWDALVLMCRLKRAVDFFL